LLVENELGMHAAWLCLRTRLEPWAAQQWKLMGNTAEVELQKVARKAELGPFNALTVRNLEEVRTSGINMG
jgi:hypothetical protein